MDPRCDNCGHPKAAHIPPNDTACANYDPIRPGDELRVPPREGDPMPAPTDDDREEAFRLGLGDYIERHARHNYVPGVSIGAEIFREITRQAAACAECASMYVGPSYAYLNRRAGLPADGPRLTRFGQLVRDTGPLA